MKNIILASTAVAALAFASPAFATDDTATSNDSNWHQAPMTAGGPSVLNYEVEGSNPAKCAIKGDGGENEAVLTPNSISNSAGFASPGLAAEIATKLNALGTLAWCTGTANSVNLTRSALSTGAGTPTSSGFQRSVIFDLNVNIAGATRTTSNTPVGEGTSDGVGNGPGVGVGAGDPVSAFGPSGSGAAVTFVQEPGSTVGAVGVHNTGSRTRASFNATASSNRLLAGFYEGEVTLTITPGV